jgi:hypothetical protein
MNIQDLEYTKFNFSNWLVWVKINQTNYLSGVNSNITISDLELQKFNSSWEIRTFISF